MNNCSNTVLDETLAKALAQKFRLNPIVAKILINRGFDDENKIDEFLNVNEKQLNDPFLLKNMDVVCDRIKLALNRNESIVVFGDYDVDGISASFILWDYLKSLNANVNYFLPCRIADGYGLSFSTVDQVNKLYNPSLIVTVDCGISCVKEIEYAKSLGIEILVTDHHEIPENAPEIFVNAKFEDQPYPFRHLCGAGLALKLVEALAGREKAKKYFPVAAIATVADIVPLVGENRAIVKLGFAWQNFLPKGLKKLIKQCGVLKISAREISFKVAPKINAPGRLGDPKIAIKLYIEQDEQKINGLIDEILEINEKRQKICNAMFEECKVLLKDYDLKNKKIIILKSPNQDKGLLGIVAAKLTGEFGRPSIVFNEENGSLKGSCRSLAGINCVKLFENAKDLLEGFGGHSMAGGLSMNVKNFDEFCRRCEEFVSRGEFEKSFKSSQDYDLEVNVTSLNLSLAKQLELLEPTGCENPVPIFKINFTNCLPIQNKNYPQHYYVKIGGEDFSAFNFSQFINLLKSSEKKFAFAEIAIEEYRGKTEVKRYLKGAYLTRFPSSEEFKFYFLDGMKEVSAPIAAQNLTESELLSSFSPFGDLYIAGSEKEAQKAQQLWSDINTENFSLSKISPLSTLLCAPLSLDGFDCFKRIVFLHKPTQFFLEKFKQKTNAEIYFCQDFTKQKQFNFDVNRKTFATCFSEIKKLIATRNSFSSRKEFLLKVNFKPFEQLAFCYHVFLELGIIKEIFKDKKFLITIDAKNKKELSSSKIYLNIRKIVYGN